MARQFQEYTEPDDNLLMSASMTASVIRRSGPNPLHPPGSAGEEKVLLPLGETTLTTNLGIPVIVVITKVLSCVYWNQMEFSLFNTMLF